MSSSPSQPKWVLAIDASNIGSGGGIAHLQGILRYADFDQIGFKEVHVWCNATNFAKLKLSKANIFFHYQPWLNGAFWRLVLWQALSFPHLLRKIHADLIWAPGGISLFAGGKWPVVTLSQNLLPFEDKEMRRYGWRFARFKMILLRWVQKLTFRQAAGVIFLTRYAAHKVIHCLPQLAHKHIIIPHGINEAFFRAPLPPAWPDKPAIKLLYVSTIDFYKHQWKVCEALGILLKAGYAVKMDLIGSAYPPALRQLRHTIATSNYHKHITYHGQLPHQQLPAIYHAADIFVFASTCETMSIAVLEAMAAGLPITCSRFGPMPEILGDCGVYFDPENPAEIADAIRQLIDHPAMAFEMAQRAHARAREYSWQRCAQETLQYLHKIAKQHAQS